jgi:2-oxo-4-hydroxy-4-carboxy--5-ureidoimidazoline (OHCU) decarboxylase
MPVKIREQLEESINNTPLFSIDKERDGALWATEKAKLAAAVWEYCETCLYGEQVFEYWSEVDICLRDCIKSFDRKKGIPFLHYFNHSIKLKIHTAKAEQSREEKASISLTAYMAKRIQKVMRVINQQSSGYYTPAMIAKVVRATGYSEKLVEKYINIDERTRTEVSLSDLQKEEKGGRSDGFNNTMEDTEELIRVFDITEQVFRAKQARVKPYLKKLITADKKRNRSEVLVRHPELAAKDYSFIDQDIFDLYRKGNPLPPLQDIAAEFKRDDASRTLGDFEDEVRETFKNAE